jgi:hypothetical protein
MTIEPEIATKPPTRRARMIEEFQEAQRRRQEKGRVATLESCIETTPPETSGPDLRREAVTSCRDH